MHSRPVTRSRIRRQKSGDKALLVGLTRLNKNIESLLVILNREKTFVDMLRCRAGLN